MNKSLVSKFTFRHTAILLVFVGSFELTGRDIFLNPEKYGLQKFDTIEKRFQVPPGYKRLEAEAGGFAVYLRNLPLLPEGSSVYDYNGNIRVSSGDTSLAAVIAIDIAGKKLDQCMDILMRIRGDYLWKAGLQEHIRFPLPDGLPISWHQWADGYRPEFAGLHFFLNQSSAPDSSGGNYENFLRVIFEYSGTQTFYHYFKTIPATNLRIGDFVIKKGRKGHAVMIIDLAEDENGNLMALIAQGDTPACQLYVLNYRKNTAWIPINLNQKYLPLPIKKKMGWDGLRRFSNFEKLY